MNEKMMDDDVSGSAWKILVVDDEIDIHDVTRLALRRRQWRSRSFVMESAMSAEEARGILRQRPPGYFQVALVDVVMESNSAGLDLCRYIRSTCPSSLRLILRTGQPGIAPEEQVLNSLDVDYYLAKSEATAQKLFTLVRACLRSSQDIATLVAFSSQLQNFTRALKELCSITDLHVFMQEGLAFLELKHNTKILFVYDIGTADTLGATADIQIDLSTIRDGFTAMDRSKLLHGAINRPEPSSGLPQASAYVPFETIVTDKKTAGEVERRSGFLYIESAPEAGSELVSDLMMFLDNWKIAHSTLILQERLQQERMLRDRMYYERLQSIATMVTGVAHELNTPLGIAHTANDMICSLVGEMMTPEFQKAPNQDVVNDLLHSSQLLTRNLQRAHTLVSSFKQLSSSQLSDQRFSSNFSSIIKDCVESATPTLRKANVTHKIEPLPEDAPLWDGYPGHLSQVVMNFIQNTIRYGRVGESGHFGIVLSMVTLEGGKAFRMEFKDKGPGISDEILPRLFEPFVTSGRATGGTGLGLAITRNIVTEILGGTIEVKSEKGKGTTFIVQVPTSAPVQKVGGEDEIEMQPDDAEPEDAGPPGFRHTGKLIGRNGSASFTNP